VLHTVCSSAGALQEVKAPSGGTEYKATVDGQDLFMTPLDLAIKQHDAWKAIAEEYAADNAKFVRDFAAAWTRLMNADRFKGPAGSVCDEAGASLALTALGLSDTTELSESVLAVE